MMEQPEGMMPEEQMQPEQPMMPPEGIQQWKPVTL
jgi:hypothetical protein